MRPRLFSPMVGLSFSLLAALLVPTAQAQDNKPGFTLTVAQIYDEYSSQCGVDRKIQKEKSAD